MSARIRANPLLPRTYTWYNSSIRRVTCDDTTKKGMRDLAGFRLRVGSKARDRDKWDRNFISLAFYVPLQKWMKKWGNIAKDNAENQRRFPSIGFRGRVPSLRIAMDRITATMIHTRNVNTVSAMCLQCIYIKRLLCIPTAKPSPAKAGWTSQLLSVPPHP